MKYLCLLFILFWSNSAAANSSDYEHIEVGTDIELVKISRDYYVHTSWFEYPGFGRFPSNGLIYLKNGKALIIDTPNTNEQTLALYDYLQDHLKAEIIKVIVGHSHSDCMGGLSALHKKGVESIACNKTISICRSKRLPIPQKSFIGSYAFEFEGEKVICRYFGGGHTVDNIVVYFPNSQILFGGCLIKSLSSNGLGSTKEAVIEDWDRTVLKVRNAYPETRLVIPGHGTIGDINLLDHTINLVKAYKLMEQ